MGILETELLMEAGIVDKRAKTHVCFKDSRCPTENRPLNPKTNLPYCNDSSHSCPHYGAYMIQEEY